MPEVTKPLDPALASKWDSYIAWLAMTDHERMLNSLPPSKTAFAAQLGVSARMLNKYEADPRFQLRLRNSGVQLPARTTTSADAPAGTPAPVRVSGTGAPAPETPVTGDPEAGDQDDERLSQDERDYRAAKAALVAGARKGDKASLDLYLKYYGKPFLEDEAAARNTDLVNLDTPALVARAVSLLAPHEMADALRAAGWSCTAPSET